MEHQGNAPETNPQFSVELKSKSPYFKYFWVILLILIIILFAVYWPNRSQTTDTDLSLSISDVAKLSEDDKRKVLEKQLEGLLKEESSLSSESKSSERFTTYIRLGEVYTALGMYDKALKALDSIKEEKKNNTRLWMTYARVYKSMNNLPEARKNVSMALDLDSEQVDNWLYMFTIMSDMNRTAQESIYQEALQRSGDLPEITAAYQKWQSENPQ